MLITSHIESHFVFKNKGACSIWSVRLNASSSAAIFYRYFSCDFNCSVSFTASRWWFMRVSVLYECFCSLTRCCGFKNVLNFHLKCMMYWDIMIVMFVYIFMLSIRYAVFRWVLVFRFCYSLFLQEYDSRLSISLIKQFWKTCLCFYEKIWIILVVLTIRIKYNM